MTNIDVDEGSGNVYEDLGFENPGEMLIKSQLVSSIGDLIGSSAMTKKQAAKTIGISQSKLARLLDGDFDGYGIAELFEFITAFGRKIHIVIGPEQSAQDQKAPNWPVVVQEWEESEIAGSDVKPLEIIKQGIMGMLNGFKNNYPLLRYFPLPTDTEKEFHAKHIKTLQNTAYNVKSDEIDQLVKQLIQYSYDDQDRRHL